MFINRRGVAVNYTTTQTSNNSKNITLGVIILSISLMVNYIVAQDWYQHLMVVLSNM